MLNETTLFEHIDKVRVALDRIRMFENHALNLHENGYWLAFSGGKDSTVILDLARRAGVKYEPVYNIQTVEPPEVLRFVRMYYPQVRMMKAPTSMWQLIVDNKMPPLRTARYCCRYLKERGGTGRLVMTGVRWAESTRRAGRRMTEVCHRDSTKHYLHPIIDWTDQDVWQYIREQHLPVCPLYREGQTRVGCILCPMAGSDRKRQAERWPRFARAYKLTFARMQRVRLAKGLPLFNPTNLPDPTPDDIFNWWISDGHAQNDPDQTVLFE